MKNLIFLICLFLFFNSFSKEFWIIKKDGELRYKQDKITHPIPEIPSGTDLTTDPQNYTVETYDDTEEEALKVELKKAEKAIQFGKDMIAYIWTINNAKNLNKDQMIAMFSTYQQVISLLQNGAIKTASETIDGLQPDGTSFTQEDKSKIQSKFKEYE